MAEELLRKCNAVLKVIQTYLNNLTNLTFLEFCDFLFINLIFKLNQNDANWK